MFSRLKGLLADFVSAWQLLTVIPLPSGWADYSRPPGRAVAFYPLVGVLLGLLLVTADTLLFWLLPPTVAASLLLGLWVGLTGMLHLDGFMDACDGLLPPRNPDRRLEIMKDSRVGAFGVVGVVFLLLLKFSCLITLPPGPRREVLVVGPGLARWGLVWAMMRYPLARPDGMASFFRRGLGQSQVGVATLVALGVAVGLLGASGLPLAAVAWLTVTLTAQLAMSRLGGLTGDIYGTICELVEAVLLLALVVIAV